jgi:hypothetical protein
MGKRLPFNKQDRKRLCYQYGYGYRARNDWGSGNLPAPWAEGDIVELVRPGSEGRLRGMTGPFFVVAAGFSIGERDEWYFRVSDSTSNYSDRLHVLADVDYMAVFDLVDTSDPEGLAERERLLAEGWKPPTCVERGCRCDCHSEHLGEAT